MQKGHLGPESSPVLLDTTTKSPLLVTNAIFDYPLYHARGILPRNLRREKKPRAKFQPRGLKSKMKTLFTNEIFHSN